jgi:nucleoside phosphorylase
MSTTTRSHDDYTVAWICALSPEKTAAVLMLDTQHPPLPKAPSDENNYTLGETQGHNIVIVCLPLGIYGTNSAAVCVAQMKTTFPSMRYALVVGIGGGAPSVDHDIRLGDVVVSKPTADHGGVIQYDYGKALAGGRFQRAGTLNKPPTVLLNAIAELHSRYQRGEGCIDTFLSAALASNTVCAEFFARPHNEEDVLFRSDYCHADESKSCDACDKSQVVDRPSRRVIHPFIHYGTIASGNQVMKDGMKRQELAQTDEIHCFEMEAAGVLDQIPSLVIRGICDYADSHKKQKMATICCRGGGGFWEGASRRCRTPSREKREEEEIRPIFGGYLLRHPGMHPLCSCARGRHIILEYMLIFG